MTKRTTAAGHLARAVMTALLAFAMTVAAPWRHTAAAGAASAAQVSIDRSATCAEGAVNGLITVSIAATMALFVEIALPTYPVLFGTGLGVGCTIRIVGEHLKAYALPLLQGQQP
jgi:hypothetical protein